MEPAENPYSPPLASLVETTSKPVLYGLNIAAIGLLTFSSIELLLTCIALLSLSVELIGTLRGPVKGNAFLLYAASIWLVLIVCGCKAIATLVGAISMRKRLKYHRAMIGALAAILGPSLLPLFGDAVFGDLMAFLISMPLSLLFGVWAFIALLQHSTKKVFAE